MLTTQAHFGPTPPMPPPLVASAHSDVRFVDYVAISAELAKTELL
jgi:hypothetical protein